MTLLEVIAAIGNATIIDVTAINPDWSDYHDYDPNGVGCGFGLETGNGFSGLYGDGDLTGVFFP